MASSKTLTAPTAPTAPTTSWREINIAEHVKKRFDVPIATGHRIFGNLFFVSAGKRPFCYGTVIINGDRMIRDTARLGHAENIKISQYIYTLTVGPVYSSGRGEFRSSSYRIDKPPNIIDAVETQFAGYPGTSNDFYCNVLAPMVEGFLRENGGKVHTTFHMSAEVPSKARENFIAAWQRGVFDKMMFTAFWIYYYTFVIDIPPAYWQILIVTEFRNIYTLIQLYNAKISRSVLKAISELGSKCFDTSLQIGQKLVILQHTPDVKKDIPILGPISGATLELQIARILTILKRRRITPSFAYLYDYNHIQNIDYKTITNPEYAESLEFRHHYAKLLDYLTAHSSAAPQASSNVRKEMEWTNINKSAMELMTLLERYVTDNTAYVMHFEMCGPTLYNLFFNYQFPTNKPLLRLTDIEYWDRLIFQLLYNILVCDCIYIYNYDLHTNNITLNPVSNYVDDKTFECYTIGGRDYKFKCQNQDLCLIDFGSVAVGESFPVVHNKLVGDKRVLPVDTSVTAYNYYMTCIGGLVDLNVVNYTPPATEQVFMYHIININILVGVIDRLFTLVSLSHRESYVAGLLHQILSELTAIQNEYISNFVIGTYTAKKAERYSANPLIMLIATIFAKYVDLPGKVSVTYSFDRLRDILK